ncbi:MAG: biotin/lipoyl-containing protein [Bernardetiaceae bacterium]
MIQITAAHGKTYTLHLKEKGFILDDQDNQVHTWDLVAQNTHRYHAIFQGRSYSLEMVRADRDTKTFEVTVNGRPYTLTAKDRFDLLLEKLGMDKATANTLDDLKAPMPGLVLDVLVKAGDTVVAGDKLIVLEAMKMENILKATAPARIQSVKVAKGDNVQKAQVMILFE